MFDIEKFKALEDADTGEDIIGISPISARYDDTNVFVIWSSGMAYFTPDTVEIEMREEEYRPKTQGPGTLPQRLTLQKLRPKEA